jgi:dTDP-4-amino-4,6-dideoxygalactose transaminase
MGQESVQFDIESLDAGFHLSSLFPFFFLKAPLGKPSWEKPQKKNIFDRILSRHYKHSQANAVEALDKAVCRLTGVRFCIGTSSGRDAIKLSLLAMDLRPGDRVILPDYCCLSVLMPVLELGLTPVFADCTKDLQMDPESVRRVMQPGDKVLIVPHLFGGLAPMKKLLNMARNNGTMVIDDAAQAMGLKHSQGNAGSGGDCGILSFGLFKPITAMGGGAFVTDNETLYRRAREVIKESPEPDISAASVLKIYLKMAWRHRTYALFLLHRWRLQQAQSTEPLHISENKTVGKISKFDALLAASQVEKIVQHRQTMIKSAFIFASRLNQMPCLASVPDDGAVGFPRWPVKYMDSPSAAYPDFFAFMLKNGIEVQPAYRPLHKYMKEMGLPIKGEYQNSLDLYNKIVCLPFDSGKNDIKILSCIEQFCRKKGFAKT